MKRAKYSEWLEENNQAMRFNTVAGEKIEVDFAGKTFEQVDKLTGEVATIVVFVAVLPYSQYIYAIGLVTISAQMAQKPLIKTLPTVTRRYQRRTKTEVAKKHLVC